MAGWARDVRNGDGCFTEAVDWMRWERRGCGEDVAGRGVWPNWEGGGVGGCRGWMRTGERRFVR